MRARPERVVRAFLSPEIDSLYPNIQRDCRARGTPCRVVDSEQLGKVSGTLHHEGFCIEAPDRDVVELRSLLKSLSKNPKSVIILLEGVENPHNLGGIIRTAAFFGVDGVVVASEVTGSLSGATCRVAEGGAESLPVVFMYPEDDPLLTIQKAGYIAYGTSPHAEHELKSVNWSPKSLIVFGAEGDGLKNATLNEVDVTLRIPTLSTQSQENQIKGVQRQKIESLNVSVAAGIVLATVCA